MDYKRGDIPGDASDVARLAHVRPGVSVRNVVHAQLGPVPYEDVLVAQRQLQRLVILKPLDLGKKTGSQSRG